MVENKSLDPALLQMLLGPSRTKPRNGTLQLDFFFFLVVFARILWFFCFLFCVFPSLPQPYHVRYIKSTLKPRIPQVFCHRVCLLIQSASMDPFFAHYQDQD